MGGKLELMAPFDYMKLCSTHVYLWLRFFGFLNFKYWIIIQIDQYNYNVGIVSPHSKLIGSLLLVLILSPCLYTTPTLVTTINHPITWVSNPQ
jgi:hypothetical protein